MLEIVTFPFIMSFIRSYKDANYIYFLLEYVHGVELYHVIRELGNIFLIFSTKIEYFQKKQHKKALYRFKQANFTQVCSY